MQEDKELGQNLESEETLSSELFKLRADLKEGFRKYFDPETENKSRGVPVYSSEFSELEELEPEIRDKIVSDPELQLLGRRYLIDQLKNRVAFGGQGDFDLGKAKRAVELLNLPKDQDEESLVLTETYIRRVLKDAKSPDRESLLVGLSDVVDIPEQLVRDEGIHSILPTFLMRINRGDGWNDHYRYLNTYFPGNLKNEVIAKNLKQWCQGYISPISGNNRMNSIEAFKALIDKFSEFPEEVRKTSIREGLIERISNSGVLDDPEGMDMIMRTFDMTELKEDPEIRNLLKKKIVTSLPNLSYSLNLKRLSQLIDIFQFDSEFTESKTFQDAIAKRFRSELRSLPLLSIMDEEEWQGFFNRVQFSPEQTEQEIINAIKFWCDKVIERVDKDNRPVIDFLMITRLADSQFLVNKNLLEDSDMQTLLKQIILSGAPDEKDPRTVKNREIDKLLTNFPATQELLEDPEIKTAIQKYFQAMVRSPVNSDIETAWNLAITLKLDNQFVRNEVLESMTDLSLADLFKIRQDLFDLSDQEVVDAISRGIISYITTHSEGEYEDLYLINTLGKLTSQMVTQVLAASFYASFSEIRTRDKLHNFIEHFGIAEEIFMSPEAQEVYKRTLITYLSQGNLNKIQNLWMYPVDRGVLNDDDVKPVLIDNWSDLIKNEKIAESTALLEILEINKSDFIKDDSVRQALVNKVQSYLSKGLDYKSTNYVNDSLTSGLISIFSIFEQYELQYDNFQNDELSKSADAMLSEYFSAAYMSLDDIDKFIQLFHISQDSVSHAARQGLIELATKFKSDKNIASVQDNTARISYMRKTFPVLHSEIDNVTIEAVKNFIQSSSISLSRCQEFINEVDVTPQVLGQIDTQLSAAGINKPDKFIPYLGDKEFNSEFPLMMEAVRKNIFSKLSQDTDLADYFLENLEKYYQQPWVAENIVKVIQHYSVAQKFIYAIDNDQVEWKDVSWVSDVLSQAKTIVEEHKKQFGQDDWGDEDEYGYTHGYEGFSEYDRYENHVWRFSSSQVRFASTIDAVIRGDLDDQELLDLGITPELNSTLIKINEIVEQTYQNFLHQVSSSNLPEDDKRALLDPENSPVKLTPLKDNVRSFVARYIVQRDEPVNLKELDRMLGEGFKRYIKVTEVDVPLYDKLYEEFDSYRETGRYPLEVYLGRDGIYAWIGRRAQDIARRRKLGPEGRVRLRKSGEILEIHPKYMVYPRYFRDNLNYETKRQFLKQEGISLDADPVFYDTGYTGTIPEQIMRVMNFDDADIETRIRLLSAPTVARRVKGIPENARQEIIEYIEHNAKLEESAEGLVIDEETGRIRHIAQPTTPEEQFYYMMVKQAIARHYWTKEQLYHEPSGNVNIDSERYGVRIRKEYVHLLPEGFLKHPKEYLSVHGELLKGSKDEDKYPDEEVVLFSLTDGTKIVAKRIELRKAKEARKEFSILLAAKKVGLPTADPVGFLSAKQAEDGSYLLMEKLEGYSGRKFEKHLRDSGKYTERQIQTMMRSVAERNRQIAETFREKLNIDKRWRIKDTIIQYNEETGEIESVIPIDWERVQDFDPDNPKQIDEIEMN